MAMTESQEREWRERIARFLEARARWHEWITERLLEQIASLKEEPEKPTP